MKLRFDHRRQQPIGNPSAENQWKAKLTKTTAWLTAFLLCAAGTAMASTLTFVDGNTVTGSFVYDATTNSVVSFDFTSTAGGGTSFIGSAPCTSTSTACAIVLNNQDGDQVFGFDAVQSAQQRVDELDIVFACGGVLNCAEQATAGNSFAIAAGNPSCPNPTGFCIASGQQFGVPESLSGDLLSAGNFITITDPPSTDQLFTFTLSTTSTGTVFGGGTTTGVPEPSSLVLLGSGIGVLLLRKAQRA